MRQHSAVPRGYSRPATEIDAHSLRQRDRQSRPASRAQKVADLVQPEFQRPAHGPPPDAEAVEPVSVALPAEELFRCRSPENPAGSSGASVVDESRHLTEIRTMNPPRQKTPTKVKSGEDDERMWPLILPQIHWPKTESAGPQHEKQHSDESARLHPEIEPVKQRLWTVETHATVLSPKWTSEIPQIPINCRIDPKD